ncbi:MAG TPA: TrkA family potassium uptake protein [Nanoarchaeota archaeon]|nr:TrkA family potassium uptake protein [Nanoarchaeota archaeon]
MKNHFGVIGLGRFGSSVAATLESLGNSVLAIDRDRERVAAIKDEVTAAKQVDAIDAEALREAGVANCDAVVIAIGEDIESSVLATLVVKELGVKRVIVKAKSDLHGKVIEKLGVERVVFPERDMGARLANQLVSSDILEFIELSPEYSMEEIKACGDMIGKTIKDLKLRDKYNIVAIALRRADKVIVIPSADEKVKAGDILILMGATKEIKAFGKCLS